MSASYYPNIDLHVGRGAGLQRVMEIGARSRGRESGSVRAYIRHVVIAPRAYVHCSITSKPLRS